MQNIYDNPDFFAGYKRLRENALGFNDTLEQPALRSLLGSLDNRSILDIGCGFGDFCRYAVQQGAKNILGVDPSSKMLDQAQQLSSSKLIEYRCIAIENAAFNPNKFDLIVSSLAFHYVKNFQLVVTKLHTWLNPGGLLVFSVEHPICTANPLGVMGEDEYGRYHPVRNYRDETLFLQSWFVDGVEKYHRKTSSYINLLLDAKFSIKKVLEPMPTDEQIQAHESLSIHAIKPPLLIISAQK